MKDNWEQSFALMLKSEGGYTNNPNDPGGMTNLGVTRDNWSRWIGHEASEEEMRSLTPETVMPMYKAWYWDKVSGDVLPYGVDYAVFDVAVNSGVKRAATILQNVLNVPEDGVIGPITLTALSQRDTDEVIEQICEERLQFLQALKTWTYFGRGWRSRVESVQVLALKMSADNRQS